MDQRPARSISWPTLAGRVAAIVVCLLAVQQCSRPTGGPSAPTPPTPTPTPPTVPTPTPTPPGPVTFVGAGDIAMCPPYGDGTQAATSRLLDTIGGTVFTTGDNAYPNGSPENFRDCYDPAWGRHKARTRPVPGNHDYETSGASAYYSYFGSNAGPAGQGYYSYDHGAWHIISLNSDTRASLAAQYAWLQNDLATHPNSVYKCTLAYWHHPLFSSGRSGNNLHMRDTYRLLYDHNVDVVLNGHDHSYERFGEQNADGVREENRGIREFVIGTGGATASGFNLVRPNSQVQRTGQGMSGVLRMTLNADTYSWEFITVNNGVQDSGLWGCH